MVVVGLATVRVYVRGADGLEPVRVWPLGRCEQSRCAGRGVFVRLSESGAYRVMRGCPSADFGSNPACGFLSSEALPGMSSDAARAKDARNVRGWQFQAAAEGIRQALRAAQPVYASCQRR